MCLKLTLFLITIVQKKYLTSKPNERVLMHYLCKNMYLMKYLLYYDSASTFTAEQTDCGGNGDKVVSVVDGVAWCKDSNNTYYRYAKIVPENLTSYTLTVHYIDAYGNAVFPNDTITLESYIGKSVKYVAYCKDASESGYTSAIEKEVLYVSANTDFSFVYYPQNMNVKNVPLTFIVTNPGTITWVKWCSGDEAYGHMESKTISYSKNGGSWTQITSDSENRAPSINVNAGDVVQFKGDNAVYGKRILIGGQGGTEEYLGTARFGGSAKFEAYGNTMSLISGSSDFSTLRQFGTQQEYVFAGLFYGAYGLKNAQYLLLPSTSLTVCCYLSMFNSCSNMRVAPELPATSLASECYERMFFGCNKLSYIKAMFLTTPSTSYTNKWVADVAKTGTFVKSSDAGWNVIGTYGVPNGWTIEKADR